MLADELPEPLVSVVRNDVTIQGEPWGSQRLWDAHDLSHWKPRAGDVGCRDQLLQFAEGAGVPLIGRAPGLDHSGNVLPE